MFGGEVAEVAVLKAVTTQSLFLTHCQLIDWPPLGLLPSEPDVTYMVRGLVVPAGTHTLFADVVEHVPVLHPVLTGGQPAIPEVIPKTPTSVESTIYEVNWM